MSTASRTPTTQKTPPAGPPRTTARGRKNKVDPAYYIMLIPVVILFTLFITMPAVIGMFYSFTNYVGYGSWHFIGLTNYTSLFSDPNIRHAYGFTLLFAVVTVVLVNAIALALAVGLSGNIKFKTALRGIFFIPMVISGIVIAYVFSYMFSTTIPTLATKLHIGPWETSILTSPHWAWIAIVIVATWQSVPGAMIIYLAGLLSIPSEVYEAAAIDGASPWRQFRSITFPLVAGYVVINTILGVKAYLNVYDIIIGTTNGGPGTSTQSVAMTIFTGFTSGDYAYQMANAVIFFLVTVIISLLQLEIIRRRGVAI
jgi:raffinose/stachyose/melibiose transport system permease protein